MNIQNIPTRAMYGQPEDQRVSYYERLSYLCELMVTALAEAKAIPGTDAARLDAATLSIVKALGDCAMGVLHPRKDGLHPRKDGLHPRKDGLHPRKDGLHPRKDGLHPRKPAVMDEPRDGMEPLNPTPHPDIIPGLSIEEAQAALVLWATPPSWEQRHSYRALVDATYVEKRMNDLRRHIDALKAAEGGA